MIGVVSSSPIWTCSYHRLSDSSHPSS
jgi:hypothetical protein